jgi:hypothetical protein
MFYTKQHCNCFATNYKNKIVLLRKKGKKKIIKSEIPEENYSLEK